jgi:hypothetical protein
MPELPYVCAAQPLSNDDFNSALASLGVDAATAWSILNVESGKAGFLADRRPQILFESHQFHGQTGGAYDASHPEISQPTWVRDYAGGAGEYPRLAKAFALDSEAALKSASWGLGQIMGFNYQVAGYSSIALFVQDACASEAKQLLQFQNFLISKGILAALQAHDWNTVALHYNGSGQVDAYGSRLSQSYTALEDPSKLPDLNVRAAQLYLRFHSGVSGVAAWNPADIDGAWGPHTHAALNAFQTAKGLAISATVDADVVAALAAALPDASSLNIG